MFVGDVSLARDIAAQVEAEGAGDYAFPFANVREHLRGDLLVGNLESPFIAPGDRAEADKRLLLGSKPEVSECVVSE